MMKLSIGPFQLSRCIGRVGMAEVWETSNSDGQPLAVKVITGQFSQNAMYRSAFENEVRAAASLQHPGIIGLVDYGRDPLVQGGEDDAWTPRQDSPWLAMELLLGGPIDRVEGLTWSRLVPILVKLLDALGHAHANGVVHRDLKPDNILFAEPPGDDPNVPLPEPVLTDFGIARATAEQSDEQFGLDTTTGTPAYMAPEQVRGQHRLQGPWTDLYAFGCLVFHLVTGSPPFAGSNPHEVMRGHLVDPLPALQPCMPVPERLAEWLGMLLAKDPCHRFQRAADAARALEDLGPLVSPDELQQRVPAIHSQTTRLDTPLIGMGEERPQPASGPSLKVPPPRLPPTPPSPRPLRRGRLGLGLFGLRRVPLIGRRALRHELWSKLAESHRESRATAMILEGPSGVGKSKLARWLAEESHCCGAAEVFRARHSPLGGQASGLPGLVAHHTQAAGLDRFDAEEHLYAMAGLRGVQLEDVPVLVDLVAPAIGNHGGVRIGSAIERYLAVARLVIAASRASGRTALIWLDDVQWGADSLAFCEFFLDKLSDVSALFLLTAQSEALVQQRLERALLNDLSNKDNVDRRRLGPLSEEAQASLFGDWLGLEPALASEISNRTEGNPLFALQLVGELVNEGKLTRSDEGFAVAEGSELGLPDDLQTLWRTRLAQLDALYEHLPSQELMLILELAATLGQEVEPHEWTALCEDAGQEIPADLVRQMVDRRLAVDMRTASRNQGWGFEHGLLRETLLEQARNEGRLAEHHQRCAQVLEALYPNDLRGAAERIGRHYFLAGGYEESLEPLLTAADALQVTSDFRQAEELLDLRDEALDALEARPADSRRVEGDLLRARCKMKRAEPDAASELVADVLLRTRVMQLPQLEGEAFIVRGMLFNRQGKLDEAERAFQSALEIFERLEDAEWVARSLHGMAFVQLWRGRFEEVLPASRRAAEFFLEADRPHEVGHAMVTTSVALRRTGESEAAAETAKQALSWFEKAGSRYGMAMAHNELGEIMRHSGKLAEAEEHYGKAFEIMESVGSGDTSVMRANLGSVLRERGRIAEARTALLLARNEFESSGQRIYLGLVGVELALCAGLEAQWDEWDEYAGMAVAEIEKAGIVDAEVAANAERLAGLALQHDQQQRARPWVELAVSQWTALSNPAAASRCRALLPSATD